MTGKITKIPGLIILEPKVLEDNRGYFYESYNKIKMQSAGIDMEFVQDNQSKSQFGVIRGLHYQKNPHAQSKLVRVLEGRIYDVALDIRQGSPTFGEWFGIELNAVNKTQLFIPRGFAHGFSVLSETAVVLYKCDEFYHPETEAGINCLDNVLHIDWKIEAGKEIISAKDMNQPVFEKADHNFIFENQAFKSEKE
ncbi:MAG: dTDP-4-dehydrorhamnose 3,5-epimerase [Bacteroidales bacterium]|nr:dTDP-4-dehydrorhamnose 3,5-epimerase [Bacteroidales bacterium]MCB9013292.1 dTDP-4-dehydrorhamnose 3,5-epimerase [Bacteroidales bacterium]